MIKTVVLTELHPVERRPKPVNSGIKWTCKPVGVAPRLSSAGGRQHYFLRSASIDRLRQFPAYLCGAKLPNARSALQALQAGGERLAARIRAVALAGTLYLGLTILCLELTAMFGALLVDRTPPGLVFLLASLGVMSVVACKTIRHDPQNLVPPRRFGAKEY